MKIRNLKILLIVMLVLIFMGQGVSAFQQADLDEEMSTVDRLYIRGIISEIIAAENLLVIRPVKGPMVRILVTPDTLLEGVRGA